MQCTKIEDKNIDYFAYLIPDEFMDDRNLIKLGAVDDEGYACAGAAFGLEGRMIVIKWLYTDPSSRELGAASVILDKIVETTKSLNLDGITAVFNTEDEDVDEFFARREFLVGADEDIYRVPVEDFLYGEGSDILERVEDYGDRVLTLRDKMGRKKFMQLSTEGVINPAFFTDVDSDLSLVRLDKEENPTGCLLVRNMGDGELKLESLVNTSDNNGAVELIAGFYDLLMEMDTEDVYLTFRRSAESAWSLAKKLTGEDDMDIYRVEGSRQAVRLFE